jgi:hypothetical protein
MKKNSKTPQWIVDKRARKRAKHLSHVRPSTQGPRSHPIDIRG